ncbi:hypothetical protein BKA70DRAFT_1332985, partial [Coprinopsis sp. MPI-PUGE-AT-0042]
MTLKRGAKGMVVWALQFLVDIVLHLYPRPLLIRLSHVRCYNALDSRSLDVLSHCTMFVAQYNSLKVARCKIPV